VVYSFPRARSRGQASPSVQFNQNDKKEEFHVTVPLQEHP